MAKVNVNTGTREELVDVAGLRPELADAIEQPLCVAHRRHVGIGDEHHDIGHGQCRGGTRRERCASIDHEELVQSREAAERLIDTFRVTRRRAAKSVKPGKDMNSAIVLGDEPR